MENQYGKWNGLINSDQKLEAVSRAQNLAFFWTGQLQLIQFCLDKIWNK